METLTWREQDILHLLVERHTNREIAQSLGLELTTVKWYNQQVFNKLGVDNRRAAAARAAELGLLDTLAGVSSVKSAAPGRALPAQVTSFVGREREIAEVNQLMQRFRLVTLTGPAGTGKTRLAIQAATELADTDEFQDGIYFVALAPITQSERVADTIAKALDVTVAAGQVASDKLKAYLANKNILVLLDNFEHVMDAAPLVSDLLSAAPGLTVAVTSREALKLYGEQEYPVPPLALPDARRSEPLAVLSEYESVRLFVQRARAARSDFAFTEDNAQAIAAICARLDGLPLAIELAAAQVKLFDPQALLSQLESRFAAMDGGPRGVSERQRTLRGAIDWSYELLDDVGKTLLARVSVFRGGHTIEAVEATCSHDLAIDVLSELASLLNKNLLRLVEGLEGEPRFAMLETIHEYAREQLEHRGETVVLRTRHAEYFTALAERVRPDTRGGPNQLRRLRQLESEHENLRAALEWSLGGADTTLGVRLVGAMGHFWWRQGHYAEGQYWTSLALEANGSLDVPVRSALLDSAGVVAHFTHERERGQRMHREALVLYQQLDNKREMGWVLIYLAAQSFGMPDEYKEATAHAKEGLALLHSVEDRAGVAQALHVLGELARLHGDYGLATKVFEEGLSLARGLGDVLRQAFILDSLGYLALYDNDPENAAALVRESLILAVEVGYKPHIPACLAGLAAVYMADGMMRQAAQLLGAADALFDARGFSPRPSDTPDIDRTKLAVLEVLGTVSFDIAWAVGQTMSQEQAIAFALEEPVPEAQLSEV